MTVLDRFIQAGFLEHIACRHLRYGRVRVGGVPTTDPATPADPPVPVTLWTGEPRKINDPTAGRTRAIACAPRSGSLVCR